MNKYKVVLNQYGTKDTLIGEANTPKECWNIMFQFLEDRNYKSYYQRYWVVDNCFTVDYGSYSSFFHVYKTDGSEITIEEMREQVLGYRCIKNGAKECDACGECQEKGLFTCENCNCEIFEDDEYYEIGGQILCEDCVRDIYRRFA